MSTNTDRFARARQAIAIADALPGRKLGSTQRSVLEALLRHGVYPSGWVWGTHRQTVKLLDTLVKRGLVETFERPIQGQFGRRIPEGHPYFGKMNTYYKPAAFLMESVAQEAEAQA